MPFALPPWLDVTPQFFTSALEAGARTGLAVADQNQRAQQMAEARAERQAQMQQRAEEQASRDQEFQQTHLLNVQKVAQDAAQLQQQIAHQTALEANQQQQESRLFNYQQGELGVGQERNRINALKLAQGPSPLAGERYLKLSEDEGKLAEQSRLAGDVAGYQEHIGKSQLWKSAVPSHQSTLTVGTDEAGRPLVTQTTGINPLEKPTMAMNTRAQENTVKYENALSLIKDLQQGLAPSDVGASGLVGEMVMDRTLAQLDPSFASKDRIEKRTALGALRESLMRTVNDDPRFSNVDREEVSKLLPSTGLFESYPDAMARMSKVKDILTDRIQRYAVATKTPVPASGKSRATVISDYNNAVQMLTDAVKAKRMTPEQAHQRALKLHQEMQDAIERFH